MNKVHAELSGKLARIELFFHYDPHTIATLKGEDGGPGAPGCRWHPERRCWSVPLSLPVARRLRECFGPYLTLGPALTLWGRKQVRLERDLQALHVAEDAPLGRVPAALAAAIAGEVVPGLPRPFDRERAPRPYQRADIKMMSITNVINANMMGIGKTIEAIGALCEAGLSGYQHALVVAPRRAVENVWGTEFGRWTDYLVFTSENANERATAHRNALVAITNGHPRVAVVCTPGDLRLIRSPSTTAPPLRSHRDFKGNSYRFKSEHQKSLLEVEWGAFIVDEFHQSGANTRTSLFHQACKIVKAERKWFLSGTPMGGKPRRLWPILNLLHPEEYPSEWNWIDQWLEVDDNGFGKKVGGLLPGRETEFYRAHSRHIVRRLKRDVLPGLPDKVVIDVQTPMTAAQARQYRQLTDTLEAKLADGQRLSANNVLVEYLRLREVANARLAGVDKNGSVIYTADSGKIPYLMEKLNEEGIRKDGEPGARAYIGVVEVGFAVIIAKQLASSGIAHDLLTGFTKESKPIIECFNRPEKYPDPYVIVMTIKTGGTALNLEAAGSAHALDEEWDPDVMSQWEERGDRGSRETSLRVYYYRTPETVQEHVAKVAAGKKITNRNILDLRSLGFRTR